MKQYIKMQNTFTLPLSYLKGEDANNYHLGSVSTMLHMGFIS